MRNIFILYFIKRINLLHIMQNGLYDVNWKIKKKKKNRSKEYKTKTAVRLLFPCETKETFRTT